LNLEIIVDETGTSGTYCPRLWDESFIDEQGRVYTCCHCLPEVLGSIYDQSLREISNNEIIQRLRRESLEGRLACYRNCSLLDKSEPVVRKDRLEIGYDELKRLKLMFGEACNIDCIMCWQDSRNTLALDFERMKGNLDLEPFTSIELQGGEPLFIPSAKAFFDHAAGQGKKISFLTNGMMVTEEWAEKIARHSDFVYFSLNAATKETHELVNAGSRWERVLGCIQRVREARERLGTELRIWGHMTIVRQNLEEVDLFIQRFPELGFDSIDFGIDAPVTRYLRIHFLKKRDLRRRVRAALQQSVHRATINDLRLRMLGLV
jgi:MoaA/NifB/PqqE/SkfB family radical SAM enzyme